jgi:hypothetical protein
LIVKAYVRLGFFISMIFLLVYLLAHVGDYFSYSVSEIDPQLIRTITSPVGIGFTLGLIVARTLGSGAFLGYVCVLLAEFTIILLSPFSVLPYNIQIAISAYGNVPILFVFLNNPLVFSLLGAIGGLIGSLFRRRYPSVAIKILKP